MVISCRIKFRSRSYSFTIKTSCRHAPWLSGSPQGPRQLCRSDSPAPDVFTFFTLHNAIQSPSLGSMPSDVFPVSLSLIDKTFYKHFTHSGMPFSVVALSMFTPDTNCHTLMHYARHGMLYIRPDPLQYQCIWASLVGANISAWQRLME